MNKTLRTAVNVSRTMGKGRGATVASKQKKKSKKIVKYIVIGLILLLIVGFFVYRGLVRKASNLPQVELGYVTRSDIRNYIDVEGIVASEKSEKVLSKLSRPVKENLVEVGDKVKAGDVLCILDTQDMEQTIAQQKSTVDVSAANNYESVASAQTQYNNAKKNLDNDIDSTIFQAEQAVVQAEQGVVQAEQVLRDAESGVLTAGIAFRTAQDAVRDGRAEADWDGEELQDWQSNPLVNQREAAYHQYEMAKDKVEDAKTGVETAKQAVEDAKAALEIAKTNVNQQVDALAQGVSSAQTAARSTEPQALAIQHLEENLEDGVVTSPIDGTVTAVFVTEGAVPTGILYIVEDLSDLKIVSSVKEYDLPNLEEGTLAEIKSELSGEDEYTGNIQKISPTSLKNETGQTANPTDPEFQIEISVPSSDTKLVVGTKARVDLVYESKENALVIPTTAIATDMEGRDIVYVLEEKEGFHTVKAIPVETGLETAEFIEILSGELAEGDEIVLRSQSVMEGMAVQVIDPLAMAAGGGPGIPAGFTVSTGKVDLMAKGGKFYE